MSVSHFVCTTDEKTKKESSEVIKCSVLDLLADYADVLNGTSFYDAIMKKKNKYPR